MRGLAGLAKLSRSDRDLSGRDLAPRARLAFAVLPADEVVGALGRVGGRVDVYVGRARREGEEGVAARVGRRGVADVDPDLAAVHALGFGVAGRRRLVRHVEGERRVALGLEANDR